MLFFTSFAPAALMIFFSVLGQDLYVSVSHREVRVYVSVFLCRSCFSFHIFSFLHLLSFLSCAISSTSVFPFDILSLSFPSFLSHSRMLVLSRPIYIRFLFSLPPSFLPLLHLYLSFLPSHAFTIRSRHVPAAWSRQIAVPADNASFQLLSGGVRQSGANSCRKLWAAAVILSRRETYVDFVVPT